MKSKKYMLVILSIFLILLVFVSSASAADANGTEVLSVDESANTINEKLALDYSSQNTVTNDTNAVENNENILAMANNDVESNDVLKETMEGNYSEVFEFINGQLSAGETNIQLEPKYYKFDAGTTITIDKSGITIDGRGATLDMNGSNIRVFRAEQLGVTFKNLIIKNVNFTGDGGAILFEQCYNLLVENCTFINNKARNGGAICFMGDAGSVFKCSFINNTATKDGGAVYFESKGNNAKCEDSWWGSNNPDWDNLISIKYVPSRYAVFNLNATPSEIDAGQNSTITAKFLWNRTGTDVTSLLPKRYVKLLTNGNLTETEGDLALTSKFSAIREGIYYVNATVDNEILGVNVKVKGLTPTNITVNTTSLDLTIGDFDFINATLDPSEAGGLEVDYNETIIKVEQNEVTGEWIVTALAEGKTLIIYSIIIPFTNCHCFS